jgi:hypothetical protein
MTTAQWFLSLDTYCPKCESAFDLLDDPDFWHSSGLQACENHTWNAKSYPGTRQLCCDCDQPTGRCEDDTLNTDAGLGPLCESCWAARMGYQCTLLEVPFSNPT